MFNLYPLHVTSYLFTQWWPTKCQSNRSYTFVHIHMYTFISILRFIRFVLSLWVVVFLFVCFSFACFLFRFYFILFLSLFTNIEAFHKIVRFLKENQRRWNVYFCVKKIIHEFQNFTGQSISHSIWLSISHSIWLSISHYIWLSISHSIWLPISHSIEHSISHSIGQSISLYNSINKPKNEAPNHTIFKSMEYLWT